MQESENGINWMGTIHQAQLSRGKFGYHSRFGAGKIQIRSSDCFYCFSGKRSKIISNV